MRVEKAPSSEGLLLYRTPDGQIRVEAILKDENVWLNQEQIAALFNKSRSTIAGHISSIFSEDELEHEVVCREFRQTTKHGAIADKSQSRMVKHYSLDLIIAVGYRVRSVRGTQFRQWATERLHEYIVTGCSMDDLRYKNGGSPYYFEEVLARIRDIRSSEKVFWRKILDIYSTSIDYDPDEEITKRFFRTVQNQIHWAVHGQTAAELIHSRADHLKPNMGLTNWVGFTIRMSETEIAKNYLSIDELSSLNRIVMAFLELAELRALQRIPMTMKDWSERLDQFIKFSERDVLQDAGKVSHDEAIEKAHREYEKFNKLKFSELSSVEMDFLNQLGGTQESDKELGEGE